MIASTIVIRTSSPLPLPTDEAVCDGASSSPSPPLFEVFDVDRALTVSVWLMCDGDRGREIFLFHSPICFFDSLPSLHRSPPTRPALRPHVGVQQIHKTGLSEERQVFAWRQEKSKVGVCLHTWNHVLSWILGVFV